MSYYQMIDFGDGACAKEIIEDTTHTPHQSPKMVSFSNYPLLKHSNSQKKIKVYSNPKPSISKEPNNKAIYWLKINTTLERSP